MIIRQIVNVADFKNLRDEWDLLYRKSGVSNLFLTHQWLLNWLGHFGNNEWIAFLGRSQDTAELKFAAVFTLKNRHLAFIRPHHSHLPAVLHLPQCSYAYRVLFHYLRTTFRAKSIVLFEVPNEASFLRCLEIATKDDWFILPKSNNTSRSIELGSDFERFLISKNKKVRHELRRKQRKFQRNFKIHFVPFLMPECLEELFDAISAIEKRSWKFQTGTSVISSRLEEAFYRQVYEIFADSSQARAYVLYGNDIPVAYVLGVIFDGSYYALKTSYNQEFSKYAPGVLSMLSLVRDLSAHAVGVSRIELLGEDARWKKELSTHHKAFCTYALYPKKLISFIYTMAYKHLKPRLQGYLSNRKSFSSPLMELIQRL
jgi:hypothetical protein